MFLKSYLTNILCTDYMEHAITCTTLQDILDASLSVSVKLNALRYVTYSSIQQAINSVPRLVLYRKTQDSVLCCHRILFFVVIGCCSLLSQDAVLCCHWMLFFVAIGCFSLLQQDQDDVICCHWMLFFVAIGCCSLLPLDAVLCCHRMLTFDGRYI